MQPQRPFLLAGQPAARDALDFATGHPPMAADVHAHHLAAVTHVDDMLPRYPEYLRGLTRLQQSLHVPMLASKPKKHNIVAERDRTG
ncbi:Uncharacterised protein [Mycobacterium tuberculosis]|nr:Uncharacterised protein [Mycobacterium tuberculosis]CKU18361.1 Uncharacterised protein [Mycobacterium tuberculosis]